MIPRNAKALFDILKNEELTNDEILHQANDAALELITSNPPPDINVTDEEGATLLTRAVLCGNKLKGIVRALLEAKANPDGSCSSTGMPTPLVCAITYGFTDNVRILLEFKANPEKPDLRNKLLPLLITSLSPFVNEITRAEIARALLEAKANPNAADGTQDDLSALHISAKYGQTEMAKVLLEFKANPFMYDKYGRSPSRLAANYRRTDIQLAIVDGQKIYDEHKAKTKLLDDALTYSDYSGARCLLEDGAKLEDEDEGLSFMLNRFASHNQLDPVVFKCLKAAFDSPKKIDKAKEVKEDKEDKEEEKEEEKEVTFDRKRDSFLDNFLSGYSSHQQVKMKFSEVKKVAKSYSNKLSCKHDADRELFYLRMAAIVPCLSKDILLMIYSFQFESTVPTSILFFKPNTVVPLLKNVQAELKSIKDPKPNAKIMQKLKDELSISTEDETSTTTMTLRTAS